MKTEVKKDEQSILNNLFTLIINKPTIGADSHYKYYFKKAELLNLQKQIERLFYNDSHIKRKVIGKIGDRTKVRIDYYIDVPKLIATKKVWEYFSKED